MRAIRLLVPTALLAIAGMPAPAPAQQHLPTLVASARADSVHTAGLMRAETTHAGVTPPDCTASRPGSVSSGTPRLSGASRPRPT